MSKLKDLTGLRFGRLTVLKKDSVNKYGQTIWIAKCDCKNIVKTLGNALKNGFTKSCGCYKKERVSANNTSRALPFGEGCFNHLFKNYKNEAKRRNIEFSLTKEQFRDLTKGSCFYCDCEPNQIFRRTTAHNGSYIYNGLDRKNNSKGYTIENCVSACGVHNKMKLDMTVEQFLQACQAVSDHQKLKAPREIAAI